MSIPGYIGRVELFISSATRARDSSGECPVTDSSSHPSKVEHAASVTANNIRADVGTKSSKLLSLKDDGCSTSPLPSLTRPAEPDAV